MSDVKLYCGDCLEILPALKSGSADAIITDMPYGTTEIEWDRQPPLDILWKVVKYILSGSGAFITTACQPFTSFLVMSNLDWFRYDLVWNKILPTGMHQARNRPLKIHESILIFSPAYAAHNAHRQMTYNPQMSRRETFRKSSRARKCLSPFKPGRLNNSTGNSKLFDGSKRFPTSIIDYSNADRTNHSHPTQKPLELYEYLVLTYSNPGDTILDPFMGSGTTGVACIQTGRAFIGVEIDENYFKIAEKRIATAQRQMLLPMEPIGRDGKETP